MLEWIVSKLTEFAGYLAGVLPTSPFRSFIDSVGDLPYIGYLNWFFPVSEILKITASWLVVIGLFYLYSIIMRWVKMIG